MLELTGGRSAYLSEETWNALDHNGKVACLRLREDRAWVEAEVGRAARAAIADVERRWLDLPRNVTRDELTDFERERKLAAANAMPAFWQAFGPREDRCAHAASADGCRVRGCPNQWRPPPPPEDRYYKGALRTQILERDEYRSSTAGSECGMTFREITPTGRTSITWSRIPRVLRRSRTARPPAPSAMR